MDYIDDLINEYKITWIKYNKAKNNALAAKQGMLPSYVKEDRKILVRYRLALGGMCALLEERLKIYGINPEKLKIQ